MLKDLITENKEHSRTKLAGKMSMCQATKTIDIVEDVEQGSHE